MLGSLLYEPSAHSVIINQLLYGCDQVAGIVWGDQARRGAHYFGHTPDRRANRWKPGNERLEIRQTEGLCPRGADIDVRSLIVEPNIVRDGNLESMLDTELSRQLLKLCGVAVAEDHEPSIRMPNKGKCP
jgi:hypothetical protein